MKILGIGLLLLFALLGATLTYIFGYQVLDLLLDTSVEVPSTAPSRTSLAIAYSPVLLLGLGLVFLTSPALVEFLRNPLGYAKAAGHHGLKLPGALVLLFTLVISLEAGVTAVNRLQLPGYVFDGLVLLFAASLTGINALVGVVDTFKPIPRSMRVVSYIIALSQVMLIAGGASFYELTIHPVIAFTGFLGCVIVSWGHWRYRRNYYQARNRGSKTDVP